MKNKTKIIELGSYSSFTIKMGDNNPS